MGMLFRDAASQLAPTSACSRHEGREPPGVPLTPGEGGATLRPASGSEILPLLESRSAGRGGALHRWAQQRQRLRHPVRRERLAQMLCLGLLSMFASRIRAHWRRAAHSDFDCVGTQDAFAARLVGQKRAAWRCSSSPLHPLPWRHGRPGAGAKRLTQRLGVEHVHLDARLQRPITRKRVSGMALRSAMSLFLGICVHSTLWMSFSLASLVPFIQLECGGAAALDFRPFWTGFLESVAVYSLDHLRDAKKAADRLGPADVTGGRTPLLRGLFAVSLVGFVASVAAMRSWSVACVFALHLALCFVYAKIKKRMPYMKAAYVSLCVVYMAVAAPAAYSPGLLSALGAASVARLLLLIFGISFTIENLQDVRDINEDRANGVVTLPSGLGSKRAAELVLALQATLLLLQLGLVGAAGLPLRPELLLLHLACCLCAISFREGTARSLFQVLLEPLYGAPLAVSAARLALGTPWG